MIDEEPKNNNVIIKILLFLFIAFLIMLISKETGYYEYKTYNKTKLTKESMLKFEEDVENGLDVTLDDYLENEYKDYSNIVSKMGSKISSSVEKFMNSGIKKTLKVLSKLFYK